MKGGKYWAYTLTELVVSITISSIILVWLLSFVGDTIGELSNSNRSSQMIVSLDWVVNTLNNFGDIYEKKSLLIDNPVGAWSDIFLFTDSWSQLWILFSLVDSSTHKAFTGSHFSQYNKKHFGYRKVTTSELTDLWWNPSLVYDYTFFQDKIYSDIYVKELQATEYNTGKILDLDMSLLLKYDTAKEGMEWIELWIEDIYNINLNF